MNPGGGGAAAVAAGPGELRLRQQSRRRLGTRVSRQSCCTDDPLIAVHRYDEQYDAIPTSPTALPLAHGCDEPSVTILGGILGAMSFEKDDAVIVCVSVVCCLL